MLSFFCKQLPKNVKLL